SLLIDADTAVLKLAVLGWPTWLAVVAGVVQLACALSLLSVRSRVAAAILLALLGCGQIVSDLLYRDFPAMTESALQVTLLIVILILEHRRREASRISGHARRLDENT
ncbi:MAG: hypothetical protein ACR2QU_12605, partial [Gammaproteobacteria bacterium]